MEAFLAPRADFLAQAVADGRITQEQADLILANMEEQVTARIAEPWAPKGYGNGIGTPDQGMGPRLS